MSTREIIVHVVVSTLVALMMFFGMIWADGGLITTLAAIIAAVAVAGIVINIRKLVLRARRHRQQ